MDRLILLIATGCATGMLAWAPGTWGSLLALVPWYFCRDLPLPLYLGVLAGLFVVGCLTAGMAEKLLDQADPGCVVIDEILGVFITLTLAPQQPLAWLMGFILFRCFDILKPFPIGWLDQHLHGGIGIMLDDVVAGIYALICLQALWLVW